MQVNKKQLELARCIRGIDGIKLAHISDLHFTGQYRRAHYHFVVDRLLELQPDLILISGDLIDYDKCLTWIEPILGRLSAPLGCSFIFGNHERRLSNIDGLARQLDKLGHFDLGKQDQLVNLPSGASIRICGNELPWLNRKCTTNPPYPSKQPQSEEATPQDLLLKIAVCHSPDQIHWARKNEFDLMLAGHTHGGQIRFPGIGPLVAPSKFGSRFASGSFFSHQR